MILQNNFVSKTFFALFLWASAFFYASAQELRWNVIINDGQVQTQDRQVVAQLKSTIETFLNTTVWTSDEFLEFERIDCTLLLTLDKKTAPEQGFFSGKGQVQYSRPIYGTNYQSPVLDYFDNFFEFSYRNGDQMNFVENAPSPPLPTLLAYYAYLILALDYDTFSKMGGNPYYEKLQNLINNAQSLPTKGWTPSSDVRSRYWLFENLNNPQYVDFREGLYIYHRLALDKMGQNPVAARSEILKMLKKFPNIARIQPNSILLQTFFNTKGEELTQIFMGAEPAMRQEAATVLLQLDPSNGNRYRQLTK
jgi:hypothetical protein